MQEFPLSKKNDKYKFEAQMCTDHTLTSKLVATKKKSRQLVTITQWNWELSCQKQVTYRKSRQIAVRIMKKLHPTCQRAARKVQFGDVAQISNVGWQGEASVVAQANLDSLRLHFDDGKR